MSKDISYFPIFLPDSEVLLKESPILLNITRANSQLNPARIASGMMARFDVVRSGELVCVELTAGMLDVLLVPSSAAGE